MSIHVYTDGSSKGNPGPGGWGVHLKICEEIYEFHGRDEMTTNNKMELKAAIEGLKFFPKPEKIKLYTDSAYVLNGITKWIKGWKKNGWKTAQKKEVKNVKLWKELDALNSKHDVVWIKVPAHAGNYGNERADYLATF